LWIQLSRVRDPSIAPFNFNEIMGLFEALILGIVQGLTEFFPVSSSTHLTLVKGFLGLNPEEPAIAFDLACHFGTLAAALVAFRKDIAEIFTKRKEKLLLFFFALTPLIPAYFLLKPLRQTIHGPPALSITLAVTATLLFLSSKLRLQSDKIVSIQWTRRARDALYIGAAQAMALIPGISRSASTISTARFLGWSSSEAVRFSFLLAIPTVIGGTLLECLHLFHPSSGLPISLPCCLIGFGASGLGALAVIGPAIRILEKGNLRPFAWYCLALACALPLLSR
jgi:undecaprenyl-diphosphatase